MKKPSKDFSTRLSAAKQWRSSVEPRIKEIYSFCAPGRERDFDKNLKSQAEDVTTFHSLGEEVATDLAGDLVTYFTPAEVRWCSYAVIAEVSEDDAQAVLQLVQEREDKLFELIQASNYNDIAPQWGFEAATHGTPALWVVKGHINQPIHIEVVPPAELLLTPGHMGILDRFRKSFVAADTLEALFADYEPNLSDQRIRKLMDKPGAIVEVMWGFWVNWADPARPKWMMEVTVENIPVIDKTDIGDLAGSCPLLVGRFNPQPRKPWGRGAGWKALPDLRVLDKIDEVLLTAMDDALQTTIIYPDDGFLNLEDGIVPGNAYAARSNFNRNSVYEFPKAANLDYGFFSEERIEQRIRTSFYQDGPRQRGETPPTAAQWLDERRRVQQRLGKPSAPLWTEMIYPFVQRIEYLAVENGDMAEAITHNGRAISVQPISPLQKAQNQDQVMVARSNLELGFAVLGEQLASVVDPIATMKNIVKASGDTLTEINDQQVPNEAAPPPQ